MIDYQAIEKIQVLFDCKDIFLANDRFFHSFWPLSKPNPLF